MKRRSLAAVAITLVTFGMPYAASACPCCQYEEHVSLGGAQSVFFICLPKMPCADACRLVSPARLPANPPDSPGQWADDPPGWAPGTSHLDLQRHVDSINDELEKQGFNAKVRDVILEHR